MSCPVIQKVSKRVVCIFKILNLKFWNFWFIRCKIGGNALTQRARGRWPRALPGSVQSHRSPMPLPNFVQSHRSPMPLPNFCSGRRRRGPCCGASVSRVPPCRPLSVVRGLCWSQRLRPWSPITLRLIRKQAGIMQELRTFINAPKRRITFRNSKRG